MLQPPLHWCFQQRSLALGLPVFPRALGALAPAEPTPEACVCVGSQAPSKPGLPLCVSILGLVHKDFILFTMPLWCFKLFYLTLLCAWQGKGAFKTGSSRATFSSNDSDGCQPSHLPVQPSVRQQTLPAQKCESGLSQGPSTWAGIMDIWARSFFLGGQAAVLCTVGVLAAVLASAHYIPGNMHTHRLWQSHITPDIDKCPSKEGG